MSFPRVPDDMKKTLHDFLVKSQRELDRELSRRPKTQDGVMYVGDESPLALTEGLDSTPFFLAIVNGKLVLKDADGNVVFSGLGNSDLDVNSGEVVTVQADPVVRDSDLAANGGTILQNANLAANGGTIPETDRSNTFGGTQTVANPISLNTEVWNSLSYVNGWEDYGSPYPPGGYRKLASGLVILRGLIRNGTANSIIATLPAGYRPDHQHLFAVQSNHALGRVDVRTNGEVVMRDGVTTWISLSTLSYYADQ